MDSELRSPVGASQLTGNPEAQYSEACVNGSNTIAFPFSVSTPSLFNLISFAKDTTRERGLTDNFYYFHISPGWERHNGTHEFLC